MGSAEEEVTQVTHYQQVAWLSGFEARRYIFWHSLFRLLLTPPKVRSMAVECTCFLWLAARSEAIEGAN